jgi:signal transduction histidine kinase
MSNKMIKKQTRQMEKTNRELQSSLSMLNRLISIISHDVRGPAANSAAALRMVLEGNSSSETTKELIGHVINNLDEVTDLLAEIMVWIESRSFKKDVDRLMKDVSVSSMINPVMKFFRGTLSQKHIVAEVSSEGDKMRCHTEPNIIKIVLRNIISNAIKYSPQGGTIQIQSREIDQFIEIRIVDRGIGMSSREVAQLKKHAVKAKPGTNKEVGMGMGLNLCLVYLRPLGISYDIHSETGKGTEFILRIPIAQN